MPCTFCITYTKLHVPSVFCSSTFVPFGNGWVNVLKAVPAPDLMFNTSEVMYSSRLLLSRPIALGRKLPMGKKPGLDQTYGQALYLHGQLHLLNHKYLPARLLFQLQRPVAFEYIPAMLIPVFRFYDGQNNFRVRYVTLVYRTDPFTTTL